MSEATAERSAFHGLYINLDSRPDRFARILREFKTFGVADRYRRIPAVADPLPAFGCFRSHLNALELAEQIGGIVHIVEDDSILSAELGPFLSSPEIARLLEIYDMLHLDMWVDPTEASYSVYKRGLETGIVELGTVEGARLGATSSYVVAPRSIAKLKRLWRRHLEAKKDALDTVCGRLAKAGEIRAAVVVPFLTGVDPETGSSSDIQRHLSRQHQWKLIRYRSQFFVGSASARKLA
jgi:hypothetical protein